jgi:formylglycine-generating enzyme required for sulfatase activity
MIIGSVLLDEPLADRPTIGSPRAFVVIENTLAYDCPAAGLGRGKPGIIVNEASPSVARNTFRNWDLPERRQIFAGFRCAA